MKMMNVLGIVNKLNDISKEFREYIKAHAKTGPFENPVFWIGAFLLGLAIFAFTYQALQKEK